MLTASFADGTEDYEIWWDKDGDAIESREDTDQDGNVISYAETSEAGVYTVHAVDAHGEVITASVVRTDEKLTIAEQPVGGTIPKDGYLPISVTVSDGKGPYTYILFRNGKHEVQSTEESTVSTFSVWYPGEYYFHIEDSKGRSADSDVVTFEDAIFRITDQTESASITRPGWSANMSVTADGGKEPYTYIWTYQNNGKWYKVGENADVISVYNPGVYSCTVKDSAKQSIKSKSITVTYTGKSPMIVEQPTSRRELTTDHHWMDLKCRAISGTGDDSNLKYDWYTRKPGGGWTIYAADCQSYPGYFEGEYQCKVTDTATGAYTWSNVAIAYEELKFVGVQKTIDWSLSSRFVLSYKGGLAPYKARVYVLWPVWKDDKLVYEDRVFVSKTLNSAEELAEFQFDLDISILTPFGDGDIERHLARYYVVVTDAAGNKVRSSEFAD